MKSRSVYASILLVVFLSMMVFSFSACDFSSILPGEQNTEGTLVLRIGSRDLQHRTIVPEIDLDIYSYTISGTGPNGASFSVDQITSSDFVRENLTVGDWTITVEAYNAGNGDEDPVKIASGSVEVTINALVVTEANVTVRPVIGTRILDLAVAWDQSLPNASIALTLTEATGTTVEFEETFTVEPMEGTIVIEDLPTGYYLLEVQLINDNAVFGTAVETVRIVDAQRTVGRIEIALDALGILSLTITQDMQSPIDIAVTGAESSLTLGADMTITAEPSVEVDRFAWYLNGIRLTEETANTLTLGADLLEGEYSLTVIVWKGSVISSAKIDFSVSSILTEIFDDFADNDYTVDPQWTFTNTAIRPGTVTQSDCIITINRSGASGSGGALYFSIDGTFPVSSSSTIEFSLKPTYSSVGDGAGWTDNEYPAEVILHMLDENDQELVLKFGYNYRGGASLLSDAYIRIAYPDCEQDVWLENEQHVIHDYFPNAVTITKIKFGGSGWDFTSSFNDIKLFR